MAAKTATATIPIVFAIGGDPIAPGLVTSLSRPGGNVTGVSFYNWLLVTKRTHRQFRPLFLHRAEITTIDNALTRPWTVTKNYRRDRDPIWIESICTEANPHIRLGKENYMLSADGYLMPAKKNQQPPDLKYFSQSQK